MAKGRSPNYPSLTLSEAIERAKQVYEQQHTYPAEPTVIAQNLGYKGLNGASMTIIGALKRYGLLVVDPDDKLRVSNDAVSILELPENNPEHQKALKQAAFATPLFADMHETYGDKLPSDVVLRHDLIKKKFLPKAADEVIRVYRDNLELVTSHGQGYNAGGSGDGQKTGGQPPVQQAQQTQNTGVTRQYQERQTTASSGGVYEFSFPLSFQRDVKAVITIYGDKLKRRDLEFLKKKVADLVEGFEDEEEPPSPPRQAIWRNKDHDQPVTIIGDLGEKDGRRFYAAKETSTGIPEDELEFTAEGAA